MADALLDPLDESLTPYGPRATTFLTLFAEFRRAVQAMDDVTSSDLNRACKRAIAVHEQMLAAHGDMTAAVQIGAEKTPPNLPGITAAMREILQKLQRNQGLD
jgi:hypothetical protein